MTNNLRRLIIAALCVLTTLGTATLTANSAQADPPPPGYRSWEVQQNVYTQKLDSGVVPLRRGYYNADRSDADGQGFGLDKAAGKHKVRNRELIEYILRFGEPGQDKPAERPFQWQVRLKLKAGFCEPLNPFPVVCTNDSADHRMIVVTEERHMGTYYEGLGSVKLDPNNQGEPAKNEDGSTNPFVDVGASYVPDGSNVGLITAFEEGFTGPISTSMQNWEAATDFWNGRA